MMQEVDVVRLYLDEISSIKSYLMSAWTLFISWYTFFFGANLLGLSVVFGDETDMVGAGGIYIYVWIIANVLGSLTAIGMFFESRDRRREMKILTAELASVNPISSKHRFGESFHFDILTWCSWAIAMFLAVFGIFWWLILCQIEKGGSEDTETRSSPVQCCVLVE